jgi:hypothetical protein
MASHGAYTCCWLCQCAKMAKKCARLCDHGAAVVRVVRSHPPVLMTKSTQNGVSRHHHTLGKKAMGCWQLVWLCQSGTVLLACAHTSWSGTPQLCVLLDLLGMNAAFHHVSAMRRHLQLSPHAYNTLHGKFQGPYTHGLCSAALQSYMCVKCCQQYNTNTCSGCKLPKQTASHAITPTCCGWQLQKLLLHFAGRFRL